MEDLENQELLYALKQENAALEQKIQYLETIIEMHHVTKFDTNLGKLKLDIRSSIRQIAAEFQAMEYDPANAERIRDLIYYMQQTIEELEKFLYLAK